MSYQVLARKWRPQTFDEVTGQAHVTTPLRNAVKMSRVPHALLLTGPRGVGKTTLARILARCLNCDDGPTDQPCGTCPTCCEIQKGISTDVQELDAASHTGVDDVRELIEAIRYAPSPGKYRIYVVDEVHMLSTAAFNALLKTLEEPPPQSIFIFATTNPEKIPATVLSRCQRYDLRRIPTVEIVKRLSEVAEGEGVSISEKSLRAIAKEGDGSLRDSMTLMDQILAFGAEVVNDDQVARVLDLTDRSLLLAIAKACVDADAVAALTACAHAAATGIAPKRLGSELLQLFRDLAVSAIAPDTPGLVDGSDAEIAELRALAERTDVTRLRRMFRALFKEQEGLTWAPQPFALLEMAVVRLATMTATDDVHRLLARLEALERQGRSGGAPPPSTSAPRGGDGPGAGFSGSRRAAQIQATPAQPSPPTREPRAQQAAPKLPEVDPLPPEVVMDRLKTFAQKSHPMLFLPLDEGTLLEVQPGHIRLALPDEFGTRRLQQRIGEFENVCASFFGQPTRIKIETKPAKTAQSAPNASDPEKQKRSRDLVRSWKQNALEHPAINDAIEILGAAIVEIHTLEGEKL